MVHRRFIYRQITGAPRQSAVFVLCVVLSMVSLVALGGFSASVNRSMLRDARKLHAGDIIIHSHDDFSPGLSRAVDELRKQGRVEPARVWEFYSVVRAERENASLLANIKVVERGYPFYGTVGLESGKPLAGVLTRGNAVVERSLLDRLPLKPGDRLRVGQAALTIRDVVLQEPDRPVNFFSLGPRVFLAAEDLQALDLVKRGSRVGYSILLRVPDASRIDRIAAELRSVALKEQERIETFRTAGSGVKRFLNNFLFFLGLIAIFTLLLAGIGIESVLTAILREQQRTVGIMKALGATGRFITLHYVIVVSVLGLVGTLLGIVGSVGLQALLPLLFKGLLPPQVDFTISWGNILEGLTLGILVAALFTFLPLHRLRDVKPNSIFGKEEIRARKRAPYALAASTILLSFAAMILWRLRDLTLGFFFLLGAILLVLVTALATEASLFVLRKARVRSLVFRQALRGLFRPRNATKPIIITLAASLTLLFSLFLIEQNLDAAFIRAYPPEAPNLFFLDIQRSQKDAFAKALGLPAEYYPVVRGRVTSINGRPVDREKERRRRGDNLAREFSLTYRDHLLEDEVIIRGRSLYEERGEGAQVSVLDDVLEMADISLGDVIAFTIQGVPLEARVTSIRTRTRKTIRPFFYFVFPVETLQEAPQSIFTAVRVEKQRIPALQTEIVSRFPNVSVIDVTETIGVFAGVMRTLSTIVRFFTGFSILAGVLLIISSIFATRFARIQEAAYFKVLGARGPFILKVFTLEHLVLGLISAALALSISQTLSWLISSRVFDIRYQAFPEASLLMAAMTALLVVVVGLLASLPILRQKPMVFLREQADE
ncbi:MAG TPA: FtsX-like permease family protein [Candidatus Methylomirabilis sp.]|nr:FtsX-like permease family protein [Candidatus Methylomirabilis sp.]